jgi:hypothetical protein
VKNHLLASMIDITWPLQPPYEAEPFRLLDELFQEKQAGLPERLMEGLMVQPAKEPKKRKTRKSSE